MSLRALLPCLTVVLIAAAGTALAGDTTFRSAHHYSLRLPAGWERIDDALVKKASRMASSAMGLPSTAYEAAFQREDAEHPFAFPYVVVRFEAGNTSGAYRDLENQIEKGVEQAKAKHGKALEEHLGDFSFDRPTVDKKKNRVWITMNADTPSDGPVRAFLAAHLGREGVAQMAFYTTADEAEAGYRDFVALSDSLAFDEGHTFGGGLFDGLLGKVVIGAGVGALIGLIRLLGRRRTSPAPAPAYPSGLRGSVPPPLPPLYAAEGGEELAPAFRYVSTRARSSEPVGGPTRP